MGLPLSVSRNGISVLCVGCSNENLGDGAHGTVIPYPSVAHLTGSFESFFRRMAFLCLSE
jgi:hypothetical protein